MTDVIEAVIAYEALDSRGIPTVACVVRTTGGAEGHVVVPSGASTGTHEALELRDGGGRHGGRGVRTAVANVNEILGPAVVGLDPADQGLVDRILGEVDGVPGHSRLGANASLAVSIASTIAAAATVREPLYRMLAGADGPLLPQPMVNIISGGAHAGRATDIQDLLVVPVGASSFSEAIEWAATIRRATATVLTRRGHDVALVADEGGLAGRFPTNRDALDALVAGIERSGLEPGRDAAIALDVAASQLWDGERYHLRSEDRSLDSGEMVTELCSWCDDAPIVSIEDPLADEDDAGWALASAVMNERIQLLGDDLFVTDETRLSAGIDAAMANSVLVKPNQTGTLTGARRVVDRARRGGYATVLSARSGETEDTWLADVACGWRCGQIKVGSTTRSERTAKWNRLLRIEVELGGPDEAPYAGAASMAPRRPPTVVGP